MEHLYDCFMEDTKVRNFSTFKRLSKNILRLKILQSVIILDAGGIPLPVPKTSDN
jgi:hypothetical protein